MEITEECTWGKITKLVTGPKYTVDLFFDKKTTRKGIECSELDSGNENDAWSSQHVKIFASKLKGSLNHACKK